MRSTMDMRFITVCAVLGFSVAFSLPTGQAAYNTEVDGDLIIDGGRIGVGTSSPASLHDDADNVVVGSGSGNRGLTIYTGADSKGSLYFGDGTATDASREGYLQYEHGTNKNWMVIGTNHAERVRITSGGNVGIGTTTPSKKLDVQGTANVSSTLDVGSDLSVGGDANVNGALRGDYDNSGNAGLSFRTDEHSGTMLYHPDGADYIFDFSEEIKTPGWSSSSSRDLKTQIEDMSPLEAFETLEQLRPVTFVYNEDVEPDGSVAPDNRRKGFIAEELPDELRLERPVVRWNDVITNNAAALKEARRRILALEDEVAQLRAAQEELRRLLEER